VSEFHNVLKKLRSNRNITQSELADEIGVSKSTISMYETNHREPDFETLEKIADYFNVDVGYLLEADNYNPDAISPFDVQTKRIIKVMAAHSDKKLSPLAIKSIEEFIEYQYSKIDKEDTETNKTKK